MEPTKRQVLGLLGLAYMCRRFAGPKARASDCLDVLACHGVRSIRCRSRRSQTTAGSARARSSIKHASMFVIPCPRATAAPSKTESALKNADER